MDINIQHINRKRTKSLEKTFFLFPILLLLSTFNFQLSTFSQTTSPLPTEHLQLWLRADSVEITEGKVSKWFDLSPNNYNIQQSNTNNRPTVLDSAINGLPAIRFNGTSNFLNGGDILNIGDKGWTYFIVAKPYNTNASNRFFSKGDRNNGWNTAGYYNWFIGNSSLIIMNGRRDDISNEGYDNVYAIYGYELYNRNDLTNKAYLNGAIRQTVNVNNVNATNTYELNIGRNHPSSTGYQFYSGEIAEIIVLNITNEIVTNNINNYLIEKYFPEYADSLTDYNFGNYVYLGTDIQVPYGFCDTAITTAHNPDFISYQWSTGENDSIIHVNHSGRYTVTVTNSLGYTSSDDIYVYFPEHFQLNDTTICAGDTIYWNIGLEENEYTFQWIQDDVQYANASNQIEIYERGTYNCIITDSIGCSMKTDTLHIGIDVYPISTSFIADGTSVQTDTAMCSGNTLGIATNLDETTSYIWNTGATSPRLTITESTDYTLTTTNSHGCLAINSIHINILGEAPEVNYAIDNLCYGDSASFIGNAQSPQGIESYLWIIDAVDSITTPSFNYKFSATGNHNVQTIVTSNNSCWADSSFNITIKELPKPNFTFTPVCSGIPMDFADNSIIPEGTTAEYLWIIEDSVIGNEENLTYLFSDATAPFSEQLVHTITLSNGCSADTAIDITIRGDYAEPRYVSPSYPTNGIYVNTDSIRFEWNYDYDILYYNLITSASTDFNNSDTIACSTNNIIISAENFYDTTYWKVIAYNHCLISHESETYSFKKTADGSLSISSNNPELQLWLRADSVELTDGKVSRWYDLSQNNYIVQQTNNNDRPTIMDSAVNELPAIRFNGTSNFLNGGDILNIGNKGWTYFIVAKPYNTNANNRFFSKGDRNNGWNTAGYYNWFIGNSSLIIMDGRRDDISNEGCDNVYAIYGYELYNRNDLTNKAYLNGAIRQTVNVNNVNATNTYELNIGRNHPSSTGYQFYSGEIAEIIVLNNTNEFVANNINNYLIEKYFPEYADSLADYNFGTFVYLGTDIHIPYGFCDTAITTAYNPDFVSYQWSTGETDSVIHVNRSGRYTVTVTNSFGVTSTDDINVYFPEHFQLQDTTICAGDTIYWNLKMRQDEYSFHWFKDGAQLDYVSNLIEIFEEGAYTCIITDSTGCRLETDTLHIAIDDYPISAGFENSDTTLCYGNRLHIASNYEETTSAIWNDGTTELEHYLTQPGTYNVTTTNTRGCTATNSINVNIQGRVPTPNFSIDGHCQNIPINIIDLSTSEIGDISTHRWFANDSLIGTEANASHIFTEYGQQNIKLYLETTDNCANDTTISVYINPQPQPDFLPKFFCQDALTEIHTQSSIAEGNVTAHSWNINGEPQTGDNITIMFSNNGINTITLSAESELGCVSTKTFEVNVRQADMPRMGISGICVGHETEFINETPFNNINPQTAWEWNFGDESESSTSRNAVHTYDSIGTYDISLAVTYANRCTTSIDTTITIHGLPDAIISTHNGCIGAETMLEAEISSSDNIAEYNWQIDSIFISREAQPTFVADTTGTFAVSLDIKTEYACSSQTTDSITIYENPSIMFTQSRDWGGNPLFVEFDNTSNGATSYHWDFGGMGESTQPNPYFIFTAPGTYNVTLEGSNSDGCTSRYTSVAITVVEPIVDIMLMNLRAEVENSFARISLVVVNLGTLPVEDLVLELRFNDRTLRESIDYIAQGEVRPYTFGTQMPIPQSNDIKSTICVEAFVPDTEGHSDTNLTNNILCITDAENLSVGIPYPIPASEQITCDIYTKIPTDLDISIFNIYGKLVKHNTISQHRGYLKYEVNVTDLSAGMYFIRVTSNDESITHKFEIR